MSRSAVLLLLLLLSMASGHATAVEPLRQRLEHANAALARAWLAEDTAALRTRYRDDAMLMPERATARLGGDAIAGYHRQWLDGSETLAYERRIHDVVDLGAHAVETGTFRHEFTRDGAAPYTYAGKYLVVWGMADAAPRVLAEIWGADAVFDAAVLPAIVDGAPSDPGRLDNDPELVRQLGGRNALIRTLVMERKGGEHAALFLPDATYLPYYTPMQIGLEAIRGYFVEHERPGPVSIEALDLRSGRIHPLDGGRLQLEEGFYRVAWRAGGDSGTAAGKSLNLWKRGGDGNWMLYRQAVNHD
jgi:ketosteroid isomerase-like protein